MRRRRRTLLLLSFGFACGVLAEVIQICLYTNRPQHKSMEYLEENHNLLTVGVVTSFKYLTTRCRVVQTTWASNLKDKLFFVGDSNEPFPLPKDVRKLKGVNDETYPPQRKVFAMLSFWYQNMLSDYKWFLRVDDDVYVDLDGLEALLSQLDHRSMIYMGHPGYGRADGYYDRFKLSPFCMGGPGVVFSQGLLRKIGPKLSSCLQRTLTAHEDVEIGLCLKSITHCTYSDEVRIMQYHHGNKHGCTLSYTALLLVFVMLSLFD